MSAAWGILPTPLGRVCILLTTDQFDAARQEFGGPNLNDFKPD
jgi:hypothetical protein